MAISTIEKRTPIIPVTSWGSISGIVEPDVSVATGATWKTLKSFTLGSGIWLAVVSVAYTSNSSGHRKLAVGDTPAASGTGLRTQRVTATNGEQTTIQLTCFLKGGTWYINGGQTSGSTLNVAVRWFAVKIADE